ncbi:MAG: helix-turn-helix domain-containing protein [Henriciella sp.]|jgi:excisionase family DNA binding protein
MSDNSNSTTRLAVSPAEAARMAGIGRTKLYELMATNEIASMKLGSRRLIRVSEIESFLDRLLAAGTAL